MKNLFIAIGLSLFLQINLTGQIQELQISKASIQNLQSEILNNRSQSIQLPFFDNQEIDLILRPNELFGKSLQDRFPNHKNYRVYSPSDSRISGFLSSTPTGIFYTLNTSEGFVSLKPDMKKNQYLLEKDFHNDHHEHLCQTKDALNEELATGNRSATLFSNGEFLRIYRMAFVVTGEFYENNGNDDDTVLSWVQFSLDGMNTIFQRDLAINFEVGNRLIFYTDSSNDIFIPDNAGGDSRPAQAGEALAENFEKEDYDIGHVLHHTSSGDDWSGGGIARLNALCNDNGTSKGQGWSGSFNNQSNGWISLFSHEVGHQCGALHTFNGTGNSCTNAISENNSYEIGSGSTIMSYFGTCGSGQNQEGTSTTDTYFHVNSLEAMINHINNTATCNTVFETNNLLPALEINPCGVENYRIPINTPFRLNADATEPNANQTLTYSWEQYDEDGPGTHTQGFIGLEAANETNTPLFKNIGPSESGERIFPSMDNILSGEIDVFDVLPRVERDINMRMVVRDNFEGGGAIVVDDIDISVEDGPFEFVTPSSSTVDVFEAGTTMNIDWETNGSDDLCEKVNISLSVDGGATYGISIADNIDYADGEFDFDIPAGLLSNTNSRIKIECTDYSCFTFFIVSESFTINSDCEGNIHSLCDTEPLVAMEGDPSLELNMETLIGNETSSLDFEITNADPNAVFVRRGIDGLCQIPLFPSGNPVRTRTVTGNFEVGEDGTYTFGRSGSGYFSIFEEGLIDPDDACAGWIQSTARATQNDPDGVTTGNSSFIAVELKKCTPYVFVVTTFAPPSLITISMDKPIVLPSDLVEETSYSFLLVDTETDLVSEVLSTSDLSGIDAGTYNFYGVQYQDEVDTQSWIGLSLIDILIGGDCFIVSTNSKEIEITEDENGNCAMSTLAVSVSSTASACIESTGTATVDITGGMEPYSILWSNGMSSNTIEGLSANAYTVTVTDNEGCEEISTVSVEQVTDPEIEFSLTGNILSAEVSGGSENYTYSWFFDATLIEDQNNSIEVGLEGDYVLEVVDLVTGCSVGATYNYIDVCASFGVEAVEQQISCNGANDGVINLTIIEGEEPYSITWTIPNGEFLNSTMITDLSPGIYAYLVIDSQGCEISDEIEIVEPEAIIINLDAVDESILGMNDGSINAEVEGGVLPLDYEWTGPSGFTSNLSNLETLIPGEYCLSVIDQSDCESNVCVNILAGECAEGEVSIDISDTNCFESNDGQASLSNFTSGREYDILWSTDETTESIENLSPGDYEVVITDDLSCSQSILFTVSSPAALSLNLESTNETSLGLSDGSAMAIVNGGTQDYTYSWTNEQGVNISDQAMIGDLAPGDYCVLIVDANGCSKEQCLEIVAGDDPCIDFSISINTIDASCFSGNDGAATISIEGATMPIDIAWSNGGEGVSIEDISAGEYQVTVSDANNCQAVETFTIDEPSELSIDFVTTNETTLDSSDSMITSTVTGGTEPYTYLWSNNETTPDIADLSPGDYCLFITDANSCVTEMCVEVLAGDDPCIDLSLTIAVEDVLCFGESTGTINASVEGGQEPYTYDWSNGETSAEVLNLPSGDYTLTLTDANQCSVVESASINETDELLFEIITTNESNLGAADGSVSVEVSGGNPPYNTNWFDENGALLSDQEIVAGLSPGTYCLELNDTNNCAYGSCVDILAGDDPCTDLSLSISVADVLCFGESTGTINASVEGGQEPYTYDWSNGETSAEVLNLPSGDYTLTLTDANQCSIVESASINETDELLFEIITTNESNLGAADGSVSVEVSGGNPPYNTNWFDENGALLSDQEIVAGLSPGTYCLELNDTNNCAYGSCVDILAGDDPCTDLSLSISVADVLCFGQSTGSINVSAAGGQEPYTYDWSNGESSAEVINLPAGDYTLTLTDANQCSVVESASINETDELLFEIITTNESSLGAADGSVSVEVSGGNPPYNTNWFDENGALLSDQEIVAGLSPGTYCLELNDTNNCAYGSCVDILAGDDPCTDLSLSISVADVLCFGQSTGSINVSADGGQEPYNYEWSNGETSVEVINLPAGDYALTLTDANQCSIVESASISEAEELFFNFIVTNESALNAADGSVIVEATGGTPAYNYNWLDEVGSTVSTQDVVSGLSPGEYCLELVDANDCTYSSCIEILAGSNPCADFDFTVATNDVLCFEESTGSASVNVVGGTQPYTYMWSNNETSSSINNLTAEIYSLTVSDANNCTVISTFDITEPTELTLSLQSTNESSVNANDGTVLSTAEGGVSPYTYTWDNAATTGNINDLSAGTYCLTVTDLNGCSATLCSTIEAGQNPCEDTDLLTTISIDEVTCNGFADGSATATSSGGVAPYTYAWSNGQNTSTASGLASGDYSVTTTDAIGCESVDLIFIDQASAIFISVAQQSNESEAGALDGAIDVNVMGGTSPYTFAWSNGSTTSSIGNLSGGDYTLSVSDANGCEQTQGFTISTNSDSEGTARVQFIHAAFDETVSITSDQGMVLPYLACTMATPPMEVPAGIDQTYTLSPLNFWAAFGEDVNLNVSFEEGLSYIAVLHGTFDPDDAFPLTITTLPFDFDVQYPQEEVLFNLFNSSYNDPTLSLENGTNLFIENVEYGNFASAQSLANINETFDLALSHGGNGSIINTYTEDFSYWRTNSIVFFTLSSYADIEETQLWVALSRGGSYQITGQDRPGQLRVSEASKKLTADIYPNPSSYVPTIRLDLDKTEDIHVEIFNSLGKTIQEKYFGTLNSGQHHLFMSNNRLHAGTYLVRIRSEQDVLVKYLQIID